MLVSTASDAGIAWISRAILWSGPMTTAWRMAGAVLQKLLAEEALELLVVDGVAVQVRDAHCVAGDESKTVHPPARGHVSPDDHVLAPELVHHQEAIQLGIRKSDDSTGFASSRAEPPMARR